jgi:hydrogenase-4 transcriptional activator
MRAIFGQLERVAPHNVAVLLTGETGTGKEVFARELHRLSPFVDGPFVPFNCSAVPRDMLDSQLFGHKRGAFTGAETDSRGVIRSAEGGTLLLDEIGELQLELQPKLLRFLESGEVHPLGDAVPVTVNVRVVSATNANLEHLVANGRFREDLYYRLNVVPIHLPPLRARREEIPALVTLYLARFAKEMEKGRLVLADEALEALLVYRWPGNVRQLINELRRLAALSLPDSTIPLSMLSPVITSRPEAEALPESAREHSPRPSAAPESPSENEIIVRIDRPLAVAVEELERIVVQRALARHGGHVDRAARDLGLSRKGLFLKRQRLGLA